MEKSDENPELSPTKGNEGCIDEYFGPPPENSCIRRSNRMTKLSLKAIESAITSSIPRFNRLISDVEWHAGNIERITEQDLPDIAVKVALDEMQASFNKLKLEWEDLQELCVEAKQDTDVEMVAFRKAYTIFMQANSVGLGKMEENFSVSSVHRSKHSSKRDKSKHDKSEHTKSEHTRSRKSENSTSQKSKSEHSKSSKSKSHSDVSENSRSEDGKSVHSSKRSTSSHGTKNSKTSSCKSALQLSAIKEEMMSAIQLGLKSGLEQIRSECLKGSETPVHKPVDELSEELQVKALEAGKVKFATPEEENKCIATSTPMNFCVKDNVSHGLGSPVLSDLRRTFSPNTQTNAVAHYEEVAHNLHLADGHTLNAPPACKDQGTFSLKNTALMKPERSSLNPKVNEFCPQDPMLATLTSLISMQAAHNDQILKIQEQQIVATNRASLAKVEPTVFSGCTIDYPTWSTAFSALVDQNAFSDTEKLNLLGKYTTGKARAMIDTYIGLGTSEAYLQAKEILKDRYGNPVKLYDAYKEKLDNYINVSSASDIQDFYDFVKRMCDAMQSIEFLHVFDNISTIKMMIKKLPAYTYTDWQKEYERAQERSIPISLGMFVQFLHRVSRRANDPLFGREALSQKKFSKIPQTKSPAVTYAADNVIGKPETEIKEYPCLFCKEKGHDISVCSKLLEKPLNEREEFVKKNSLCFRCGKKFHVSKDCKKRKECTICKKLHMTILHRGESSEKISDHVDAKSFSARVPLNLSFQPILPVWVFHEGNSEHKLKVYALIDSGSNVCFVSKNVQQQLGLCTHDTHLKLSTVHGTKVEKSLVCSGLVCHGHKDNRKVTLPRVYVKDILPISESSIPTPENVMKFPHLRSLTHELHPLYGDIEVGLIIGTNCQKGTYVEEIRSGTENEPQAFKFILGWTVQGPMHDTNSCIESNMISHRIVVDTIGTESSMKQFISPIEAKEIIDPSSVTKWFQLEYEERDVVGPERSSDDVLFLRKMNASVKKRNDNHIELALPFKDEKLIMPESKGYAYNRLCSLKKKLLNDHAYEQMYSKFMEDLLINGHAEEVPLYSALSKQNSVNHRIWYLPHFGVVNPNKPNKVRVVFDCAATVKGVSLNQKLLSGPDLTNSLLGVLLRFRINPIAVKADIKSMFHQVYVNEEDRDMLRFFWWKNNQYDSTPTEYRMSVHLFGATSSPSCAGFALKQCLEVSEDELGIFPTGGEPSHLAKGGNMQYLERIKIAKHAIDKHMYVDDLCSGADSISGALNLIHDTKAICLARGFELTKFQCNNLEVRQSIPKEDLDGNETVEIDFDSWQNIPVDRALGVRWHIQSDALKFSISMKNNAFTRRGVLSTVCSVYDPIGLVAPFVLIGKRILQQICKMSLTKLHWDEPIPGDMLSEWSNWREDLINLSRLNVRRCYLPSTFSEIKNAELHHFADASPELGFGACSYLRLEDVSGNVSCNLLLGKSRVPPMKTMTVPRMELNAAVLAVRISQLVNLQLEDELKLKYFGEPSHHHSKIQIKNVFWSDSKVVLGYIQNDSKKFKIFVANRVAEIRENTLPNQWRYVPTDENPADFNSRGLKVEQLLKSFYHDGPTFLWQPSYEHVGKSVEIAQAIVDSDPEVKVCSNSIMTRNDLLFSLARISSWNKMIRVMALILRVFGKKVCKQSDRTTIRPYSVDELQRSQHHIVKLLQLEYFSDEFKVCKPVNLDGEPSHHSGISSKEILFPKGHKLSKLNPFIDEENLLRVGGRIRQADVPYSMKHPLLLPKDAIITTVIINYFHEKVHHQGRGITSNEIRQNGFWILGGSNLISKVVFNCVTCKRLRGKVSVQRMADLPEDRLKESPPFTFVGCDFFGPFIVKDRRSNVKRYGCIFTCLVSRAVHLEVAFSLETCTFMNCLRRFICRRGPVREIRCDKGTNFVGCSNELRKALDDLDTTSVHDMLLKENCDWVEFNFNSPHSSHMGGAWERMIRTVRSVLSGLLVSHSEILDTDLLNTLFCEIESIVNCRPITAIDNSTTIESLTPGHLLTSKNKVVLSPPGSFTDVALYSRKRWQRIQYLADQFWVRFKSEYLLHLQQRQKWTLKQRNFKSGDVVIVKDGDMPRNCWKLAKVISVDESSDGLVRKAKIMFGNANLDKKGKSSEKRNVLERPIHKLVLLLESELD